MGTLLVGMNVSLATNDVIESNEKVVKTEKSVEMKNKSEKIVNQTKNKTIAQKYTVIGKSKKSYGPQYVKYNKDEVSSKAKCSCGKESYSTYHETKFKNYCTLCKKNGQLVYRAHYEGEWTCKACGADYCLTTGKEKLSSSKKTLKKIEEND